MLKLIKMHTQVLKPLTILVVSLLLATGCATGKKSPLDDEAGLNQWQKANKRLSRGNYDKALVMLDEIIVTQPKFAAAHINRGIALAGLSRNAEALLAIETGLKLKPKNPRTVAAAYNQAGMLYRRSQQLDAARKTYEKAVRADETFDLPLFNLALLHEQALDQPAVALEYYARFQALQDSPDPAVQLWSKIIEKELAAASAANEEPAQ